MAEMRWRGANLPETTSLGATKTTGMSKADYDKLFDTDKMFWSIFTPIGVGHVSK